MSCVEQYSICRGTDPGHTLSFCRGKLAECNQQCYLQNDVCVNGFNQGVCSLHLVPCLGTVPLIPPTISPFSCAIQYISCRGVDPGHSLSTCRAKLTECDHKCYDRNEACFNLPDGLTCFSELLPCLGVYQIPTVTPSPSGTPSPSATQSPSVTPSPSITPSPSVTPSPSITPPPSVTGPSPTCKPSPGTGGGYTLIPNFPTTGVCYPTTYYAAEDEGVLPAGDYRLALGFKCQAKCDRDGSKCKAYVGVLSLAADSGLGFGVCFFYDAVSKVVPRACADAPSGIQALSKVGACS